MSRKHYVLLAQALADTRLNIPLPTYLALCNSIADVFSAQSSTFNRQKFIDACLS